MSRYRGPRIKLIRRLKNLPGLTKYRRVDREEEKKSRYRIRLEEKQKLRFHYGLTDRQLLQYIRIARRAEGSTGQVLLQLLEMRLDNILFRLGMALTIPGARQLVNHRHILVNGLMVDIPSYRCKSKDVITIKDRQRSRNIINKNRDLYKKHQKRPRFISKRIINRKKNLSLRFQKYEMKHKVPFHLTLYSSQYKGVVNQIIDNISIGLDINELLVIEYFSRRA
uniref:Small ribosomal subunit protein uS4c n=2 Tax=Lagarostrobos franklinii TaxID=56892 RepID=A0A3Q9WXY8_LAGFR|nr:ribosomal protein S4 [Lagarostrobos franklinii]BBF90881.1 ribosomal protein S4 [Lagarostrobos franklinii]